MSDMNRESLDELLHSMRNSDVDLADAPVREYRRRKKKQCWTAVVLGVVVSGVLLFICGKKLKR